LHLKTLEIKNFRNYAAEQLEPGPSLNIIYGENAQGKTNLLEAVYYLLSAVSHRTRKDRELIKWETNFLALRGEVLFQEKEKKKLEVVYKNTKNKTVKLNGKNLTVDKYFAQFPVVIFYPQDLYLVTGGPAERRRFLNTLITRINPSYYHHLINYYRALRQRNNLLREMATSKEEFKTWEDLMATYGGKIIVERTNFIKELSDHASFFQEYFTSGKEKMELVYKTVMDKVKNLNNVESWQGLEGESETEVKLSQLLERKREEELKRGYTLVGPHLEDIKVMLNNREVKKFSSQGQKRTAVISMKMAQSEIMLERKKEKPLLLMDDCFSELDPARGNQILDLINNRDLQCLVTSYEKLELPPKSQGCLFRVEGGTIKSG